MSYLFNVTACVSDDSVEECCAGAAGDGQALQSVATSHRATAERVAAHPGVRLEEEEHQRASLCHSVREGGGQRGRRRQAERDR